MSLYWEKKRMYFIKCIVTKQNRIHSVQGLPTLSSHSPSSMFLYSVGRNEEVFNVHLFNCKCRAKLWPWLIRIFNHSYLTLTEYVFNVCSDSFQNTSLKKGRSNAIEEWKYGTNMSKRSFLQFSSYSVVYLKTTMSLLSVRNQELKEGSGNQELSIKRLWLF